MVGRVDDRHHIEIQREGLGEVLPRVHRGVGGHAVAMPVRGRAVVVVALERIPVGRIVVVAEQGAECRLTTPAHQQLPIIVADLVAEMPDQGAMGLLHVDAAALALGVVGLVQIDGDTAARVPREHALDRAHGVPDIAVAHELRLEVELERRIESVGRGAVG